MAIQHAVLSLLAEGPGHGYELKAAFDKSVGPHRGALNIGHLYQVLDRLSRDGLATSHRVARDTRHDRTVYEITDAGREELDRWLTEPSPRTGGYRDDFFLKIMAAAHTREPRVLNSLISVQRAYLLHELRNLESSKRDADLVVSLLLAAAIRHVSADLAFLDDVEEQLLRGGAGLLATLADSRQRPTADTARTPQSADPVQTSGHGSESRESAG
jgi:DNA-binding PadR family transcriptional regulator